jgi:hypothetical protein
VQGLCGNYYLHLPQAQRTMLAEIGFRLADGRFLAMARSSVTLFDRDRPSATSRPNGLYVGGRSQRMIPVGPILDARVYERLNNALAKRDYQPLRVAVVNLLRPEDTNNPGAAAAGLELVVEACRHFGEIMMLFGARPAEVAGGAAKPLMRHVKALSLAIFERLASRHARQPFHLIDCHDWFSCLVSATAAERFGIPMVLTLHSIEKERAGNGYMQGISAAIARWERHAVAQARHVIVSAPWAAGFLTAQYGAAPERISVIPNPPAAGHPGHGEIAARCLAIYHEVCAEFTEERHG